jgi:microcompartment protein CcmK/EutM
MTLCRVEGTVVATAHHPAFDGRKLLIVQPVEAATGDRQAAAQPIGASFLAIDDVQAGVGDLVLVMREGNGVRQLVKMGAQVPIRSIIVAIVDEVEARG